MDFSKQFKSIENLSKQLDKIVEIQNQAYANLDEKTYEKVKQHQIDANKMLKEFRRGNFNVIEDLVEKYTTGNANNSRK
jgi:uncharacterized protein (UPF0297 family)